MVDTETQKLIDLADRAKAVADSAYARRGTPIGNVTGNRAFELWKQYQFKAFKRLSPLYRKP